MKHLTHFPLKQSKLHFFCVCVLPSHCPIVFELFTSFRYDCISAQFLCLEKMYNRPHFYRERKQEESNSKKAKVRTSCLTKSYFIKCKFLTNLYSDLKKMLLSCSRVLAITVCNTPHKTGTNIFFICFALHLLLKAASHVTNIFKSFICS